MRPVGHGGLMSHVHAIEACTLRPAGNVTPLVGRGLDGPSFAPHHQAAPRARLGEPVWGSTGLLRDLELRLALSGTISPRSVRVPRYAAQMTALGEAGAFYAASFATDALGTADALLAWRDGLVEAGWQGGEVAGGGERLAALARLESEGVVPRGDADRLMSVHAVLAACGTRIYEAISLVEERSSWPGMWQRIFTALESRGTAFSRFRADLPGAAPDSDLARLQSLLRSGRIVPHHHLAVGLRGDGSILLVRGETAAELAAVTAALVTNERRPTLVVRAGDAVPLEGALPLHGLATQGLSTSSAWRPAMQILPLAVELAFEPRDPHRALELLSLPVGPFRGALGTRLASAIARSPGIGGREWQKRKDDTREFLHALEVRRSVATGASEDDARAIADAHVAERIDRVAEWLEAPGASPGGAPTRLLLDVAARVETWLRSRLATAPDVYAPALVQAKQLVHVLTHDSREMVSREEVRQLLDTIVRAPHDHDRSIEQAGRISHVSHPSAVLAPCARVIFWNFVAGTERRPGLVPWTGAERVALESAGVRLQDPSHFLRNESDAWRRAVMAAREQVVFVIPSTMSGAGTSPHPLWDEIVARLRLDEPAIDRMTIHTRELLDGRKQLVPVELLAPLALPASPAVWNLGSDVIGAEREEIGAATSFETLATCPLRWVLERGAELRSGGVAKIATDSLLNGNLGHRLIEELFIEGAFSADADAYASRADAIMERLIATEAATLLLPGRAFERSQLVLQLLRATRALRRYLDRSKFRVVGVEEEVVAPSPVGALRGRLDMRLVDDGGRQAVLDLKWADARYRVVVAEGRAVQLALYAQAIATDGAAEMPPAGYFALRSGKVITADPRMRADETIDGEPLSLTWVRVQRTASSVHAMLKRGVIPVAGTRAALPLLDALGIPDSGRPAHYAPRADASCGTCSYGPLCGRAWESFL